MVKTNCFDYRNSSIEPYYNYDGEGAATNGFFYLNNFQNLGTSFVTLFELTVVNNWYVIMEGYAITTGGDWSRSFFMSFYVFTMIVITIIVAFILEAFLFRIQYKRFLTKAEGSDRPVIAAVQACLLVLVQVKGSLLLHKLFVGMQMSCSEIVSPYTLLDL